MAKLKTIIVPGDIYFITITIIKHLKIFTKDKYYQIIIDNLKFYRKKYKFKLFGFVVMPEHLHLLILPKFVESVGSEEPTSTHEVSEAPTYTNGGCPLYLGEEPTFTTCVDAGSSKFVEAGSSKFVEAGSLEPAKAQTAEVGFSKPTKNVGAGPSTFVQTGSSKPAKAPTISDIMRDFKKYTAIKIIKQLKIDGREDVLQFFHYYAQKHHPNKNRRYQVWRDGFWSTNIYSDKFFHQKLDYIHNNPIRAGLVKNLDDYPWSSYQNYYLDNHLLIKIDYREG